ncbi:MAG TPA: AAA family ATPase, partial [Isosphaeraceae bacterium]|nr:AAA family ATPase [Isosphaeraceae bacterium]
MLRELSVQNLALIEDARVELQDGYCAWTGETGAGKSLLLTALGLVLGEKASSDLVRSGKDEARAAAVFELADPTLRADVEAILGGSLDEEMLILTRRISAQGRSQAHANGLPVAVATLKQLGRRLIDLHGQHQTLALLEPDHQRGLLDAFGNLESILNRYRESRDSHDLLRKRRLSLMEAAERRLRERDLLAFERDELASAEPKAGECDELTREAHRLANSGELRSASADGYHLLYERDGSVQELLGKVARRLAPLADAVPELSSATTDLERLAEEVREVARSLSRF